MHCRHGISTSYCYFTLHYISDRWNVSPFSTNSGTLHHTLVSFWIPAPDPGCADRGSGLLSATRKRRCSRVGQARRTATKSLGSHVSRNRGTTRALALCCCGAKRAPAVMNMVGGRW